MIAGAIAGSATVLVTNPIWVVNTRMTTRKQGKESDSVTPTKTPTTVGTFLSLIREEGPQALFAGVMPALVLVINPILQYTIFEQLKNILEKKKRITPTMAFLLGALGKLFATSITYPYITVKSRAHVAGRDDRKENMLEVIRRIIRDEGYTGLYKGRQIPDGLVLKQAANIHKALGPRSPKAFSLQPSSSLSRMFCMARPSNCASGFQRRPSNTRLKYLPYKWRARRRNFEYGIFRARELVSKK